MSSSSSLLAVAQWPALRSSASSAASGRAGGPTVGVVGALVLTGRTRGLLEAQVRAALAEQLGTGDEGGLPVEDDGVVLGTDEHGGPGHGTGLEQRLLDAEPAEPVGEVADGLVVGEVGLADPAGRALAVDRGRPRRRGCSRG